MLYGANHMDCIILLPQIPRGMGCGQIVVIFDVIKPLWQYGGLVIISSVQQ